MKKKLKDKFLLTAKQLLTIIGEKNFDYISNCVTRVRFYGVNKTNVNDEQIDQVPLVKGHNWSGNELQIIIGTDASKLHEQIDSLLKHTNDEFSLEKNQPVNQNQESWWKRIIGALNGIFIPVIPVILAAGLVTGIATILSTSGLIDIKPSLVDGRVHVTDMDWLSGLIYILANSQLTLLSVFFCYSTVKYLKGNEIMGIVVGLLLSSPFFFTQFSGDATALQAGGWDIWTVNDFTIIRIEGYPANIIPAIAVATVYVYVERLVKKIIPEALDMLFTPFIALVIIAFLGFFVVLPIFGLIETGIDLVDSWLYGIDYGVGGFAIGFLFSPMVVLGITWPVILTLEDPYIMSHRVIPLKFFPIANATLLAMVGTMMALYLMEIKDKNRKDMLNTIPPLFLGFSELAVYQFLIKKPKAFWLTNLVGGFMGMAMGWLQINQAETGGFGILALLSFGNDWQTILLYFTIILVTGIVDFLLISIFYQDKKKERKLIKHNIWQLSFVVWVNQYQSSVDKKESWAKLREQLKQIDELAKQTASINSTYYKKYESYQKLLLKSNHLKTKNSQKVLNYKEKTLSAKVSLNLEAKNLIIKNELVFKTMQEILSEFLIRNNLDQQPWINKFYNSLNDNLIYSEVLKPKTVELNKTDYYQINNKVLLKLLPKMS